MQIPPYNPIRINMNGLGCTRFARRYLGYRKELLPEHNGAFTPMSRINSEPDAIASVQKEIPVYCFLFLQVLRCFTSLRTPSTYIESLPMTAGFPHSDISGSKVIWHLPETYRSHITSFIAPWSQGIHHTPFVPIGNVIHRCIIFWVSAGDTYSGLCHTETLASVLCDGLCCCELQDLKLTTFDCVSGTKRPDTNLYLFWVKSRHTTYSRAENPKGFSAREFAYRASIPR